MSGQQKLININEFHPETQVYDYASMLFTGAKKTGKSYCCKSICYHLRNRVYDVMAFCGTKETDYPWTTHIPNSFIFDDYYPDEMNAAISRQQERDEYALSLGIDFHTPLLVIFEDLEFKKHNVFTDENSKRTLLNGRHDKLYIMVLIQYVMKGITKETRNMFDFVFLQKETDYDTRTKLWKVFGGCCKTFDMFEKIFFMCTEDHGTLVIALRAGSYNIEDNFFWYKAQNYGNFRIGHRDIWKFQDENALDKSKFTVESKTFGKMVQKQVSSIKKGYVDKPNAKITLIPSNSTEEVENNICQLPIVNSGINNVNAINNTNTFIQQQQQQQQQLIYPNSINNYDSHNINSFPSSVVNSQKFDVFGSNVGSNVANNNRYLYGNNNNNNNIGYV
jgi:hypothetical protein